jgi:hypothetical protein
MPPHDESFRRFGVRGRLRIRFFLIVACLGVLSSPRLPAEVLQVTGGDVVSTIGPRSFEAALVSGTSAEGTRSRYTATGPLTLTDTGASIRANDSGEVFLNGGATAAGYGDIYEGGSLTLNSAATFDGGLFVYAGGTLTIGAAGSAISPGQLYLDGPGSFTRAVGGTYSAGSLWMAGGATASFTADDTVTADLLLDTGATLDLASPLALTGQAYLNSGATLTRTTATLSATTMNVSSATFASIAGDSLDSVVVSFGGQFTNSAALTLSTLSVSGDDGLGTASAAATGAALSIADAGIVTVGGGGMLDLSHPTTGGGTTSLLASNAGTTVRVATNVSGFGSVIVDTGAVLELDSGDLSATSLTLSGSDSFVRSGGTYTVDTLQLSDGAIVGYGMSDTIADGVVVGADSVLGLARNLSVTGSLVVTDGGRIVRTNETIAAPVVTVSATSNLPLLSGDTIDSLTLLTAGQVASPAALRLTALSIDDPGSVLDLTAFDGIEGDLRYSLRVYGDVQTTLASYLADGRLTLGASPKTPGVLYDFASYGNFTYVGYVVAVPEPSTLVFGFCSLAAIPFLRRRR